MLITFELSEDIAQGLEAKWTDIPRAALESLALEAYRSNALSAAQLCRLLWFRNAHAGGRLFEGARSLRLHGGRVRAGSRYAPSGSGEGVSALSRPLCVV